MPAGPDLLVIATRLEPASPLIRYLHRRGLPVCFEQDLGCMGRPGPLFGCVLLGDGFPAERIVAAVGGFWETAGLRPLVVISREIRVLERLLVPPPPIHALALLPPGSFAWTVLDTLYTLDAALTLH